MHRGFTLCVGGGLPAILADLTVMIMMSRKMLKTQQKEEEYFTSKGA